MWCTASLISRPPPFYLLFTFTIIHGSGRLAKNRKGLGAFITWMDVRWTWWGGVGIQIYTYWTWKRVSYPSRQVVSITLRSGVQNTVECWNGWSCALFWQLGPSPPMSTLCPPRVHLKSFMWWMLPIFRVIVNAKGRSKQGRTGTEASAQLPC